MKYYNFALSSSLFLLSSFFSLNYNQDVSSHAIQLYLEPSITDQYLITIFLEKKDLLDKDNNEEVDISAKFQLDFNTNQALLDNALLYNGVHH